MLGLEILPTRKEVVDFAGPYEVSSQGLMTSGDDTTIAGPESLRDPAKSVCTLKGTTTATNIRPYLADPAQLVESESTIGHCVDLLLRRRVSAVTTDRSVLLGLLPDHGATVKIVGPGFADTSHGIALPLGDRGLRELINDSIERSYRDGRYGRAWRDSMGHAVPEVAAGPPVDRY